MGNISFDPHGFVTNFVQQEIRKLFLSFLYMLEDQRDTKLLSDEEFARLRKRVLDAGNNALRSTSEQLDNFQITIGQKE